MSHTLITNLIQVFCEDVSQLVLDVLSHRGMNPQSSDVHCGIDGGQGSLKLAVTITERDQSETSGRAHYSHVRKCPHLSFLKLEAISRFCKGFPYDIYLQGVAARDAKNSSVKKLFLLGIVPGIPENYFNVKAILSSLNIEAIEFTAAADVKMRKFCIRQDLLFLNSNIF